MNFRFPVFLDVTGKRCLVTGQGLEGREQGQGADRRGRGERRISIQPPFLKLSSGPHWT